MKGYQKVDLTWSPSGQSEYVVVHRDSVPIQTVNDGVFTDPINRRGSATYTYKVCSAGPTTTCSNTVTVTF